MSTVYKHWEALVKRVWGRSWKALHSSKVGWLEKVTSWKMWLTPMLKSIQMNTFKQESPAHAAVKIDKACNIVFWGFYFQPFTNHFHCQTFYKLFSFSTVYKLFSLSTLLQIIFISTVYKLFSILPEVQLAWRGRISETFRHKKPFLQPLTIT